MIELKQHCIYMQFELYTDVAKYPWHTCAVTYC